MLTVYATEVSSIYGHGNRFVIWFSGCSIRCKGCMNNHMWDKESGTPISVEQLMSSIESSDDIVGVTYIGGEPMDQDYDILSLTQRIVDVGLDLILFTGYDLQELSGYQKKVADIAVVIISGRFDESKRNTYLLHRGSSNQIILVKDASLLSEYELEARQVEVIITPECDTFLGFPEDILNDKGS